MWKYPEIYDVIVIGAGHAGCEAAHASARMGCKTLLLTMNLDTIGKMSCNPSVGGTAKGHIVREIDALGGLMGKVADRCSIQFRMLNASKGPAVRSPRSQADKAAYAVEMKHRLEKTPNLDITQGTTESLLVENGIITGITTQEGITYGAKNVIVSSGTFMRGLIHIGMTNFSGGRGGDKAAMGLSPCLESLGFKLGRLKTGTPPRINRRSVDFTACEAQPGDEGVRFSYDAPEPRLEQVPCYITYTSEETKRIIQENLHRSPLYAGVIQGVGPRYCPSIEDKIVRFADKERHQIFLEPEGLTTEEIYVNGISTSLPFDVQLALIHSIKGLEKAEIMRAAYAIEYDYVKSEQILATLETKLVAGLFLAGQVNGTTGYEEAAGQGLVAGINAACKVLGKPPFVMHRSDSYIGVMIDDLIRFDLTEPYRMFTSRAEHRLLLRQDNADLRLRPIAYELNMISHEQYTKVVEKQRIITSEIERLAKSHCAIAGKSTNIAQLICRTDWDYQKALSEYASLVTDYGASINEQIELSLKYAGYIERQNKEIAKFEHLDLIRIPKVFDYSLVTGLRSEAKQKLLRFTPENLGAASRISGVSPADISILMIALQKQKEVF
ncbi:MAG TPA: tRNA uridine-5-carboxymethylaminomethyl(34) synthesis enzyme MnmG [Chlamydiales bacterium]|jgi:tRNA uridine 5-carboxymethylaminomethyl modification enzyme|nr:tRNA uridine-5-carboxymethylaminomethyl(34) synthesis enzyme MnmG [Chlamydiales bacterium]